MGRINPLLGVSEILHYKAYFLKIKIHKNLHNNKYLSEIYHIQNYILYLPLKTKQKKYLPIGWSEEYSAYCGGT
jgi:hypothetical protein